MALSMKQILVINSGSSSLKLSVFQIDEFQKLNRLLDSHLKGINAEKQTIEIHTAQGKQKRACRGITDQHAALKFSLDALTKNGLSIPSLCAVGHRVVHGGLKYFKSIRVTPSVISELEKISILAPLHNPACIAGIKSSIEYLGNHILQFAVFDTAFHHNMPKYASQYALPSILAEKYQIRRYGFHGISHEFLCETYFQYKKKKPGKNSKIITVHLGSGCSITAIKGGVSVDTSMGFTPLEGLIMSTRTGDIDPSVLEFLSIQEKKTPKEIIQIFNDDSGLLGISKKTSDMKTLEELSKKNDRAKLAIEMFCYRIVKYIGAYLAALEGLDAIIFSGGIGENSASIRSKIITSLKWMGIALDAKKNRQAVNLSAREVHQLSPPSSSVEVFTIGTDENVFIAKEIIKLFC